MRKSFQSDKIFVKGKIHGKKEESAHDDIGLLALQISCPIRTEIKSHDLSSDIEPIHSFYCINIETRQTSSMVFVATLHEKSIKKQIQNLRDQIFNVVKSANEKIYFIDFLEIKRNDYPFADVMTHLSQYCFIWETHEAELLVSYFRLPKPQENERFKEISLDKVVDEPAASDMYLYFPKNNRYVQFLKKGSTLENHRKSRLTSRGFDQFYTPKGQSLDLQVQKAQDFLEDLLIKYHEMNKAG